MDFDVIIETNKYAAPNIVTFVNLKWKFVKKNIFRFHLLAPLDKNQNLRD